MDKQSALNVWNREFGNVDYAHDFTGRKIKREDYMLENQVGWVVTYMKPIKHGGKKNEDNEIIVHHITALEKGDNFPEFEVVGVKYRVSYDQKLDYYYIEKVME